MEIRTRARPRLIGSTVQDVAPASVVVAARLGASRKVRGRGHHFVFGAVARRAVGFAPAYVENLKARVGVGLTTGTVRARDTRCVRKVICHRSSTHVTTPPDSTMPTEVSRFRWGGQDGLWRAHAGSGRFEKASSSTSLCVMATERRRCAPNEGDMLGVEIALEGSERARADTRQGAPLAIRKRDARCFDRHRGIPEECVTKFAIYDKLPTRLLHGVLLRPRSQLHWA